MYTAHVHFFTNLDLFCIDNARVIYRKIRYLLFLLKHSVYYVIVSVGVRRYGKCHLFFFRDHLLPQMIDCLYRSDYCFRALRARVIRNYLIPFEVPPVYNGVQIENKISAEPQSLKDILN